MKITDYAMRATFFDTFIKSKTVGIEIGVDAGSHIEAILSYCDVERITLVDLWENEYVKGFCEGRLKKWRQKIDVIKGESHFVSEELKERNFDWIYIDITHDYPTVLQSLKDWWPRLKAGGIMGYRNYSICKPAIDEFVITNNIKSQVDDYYNEIILFR